MEKYWWFFEALSEKYETKSLPVNEFRAVNYTIDFALARNDLNIKKTETMFTWDKLIYYPLPTYIYRAIFNEKTTFYWEGNRTGDKELCLRRKR